MLLSLSIASSTKEERGFINILGDIEGLGRGLATIRAGWEKLFGKLSFRGLLVFLLASFSVIFLVWNVTSSFQLRGCLIYAIFSITDRYRWYEVASSLGLLGVRSPLSFLWFSSYLNPSLRIFDSVILAFRQILLPSSNAISYQGLVALTSKS